MTRELPHNIPAEKACIGAILITNAGYDQIARRLEARHFFRDVHRRIYQTCVDVLVAGKGLDLTTLCEALKSRGWLEDMGGQAYVSSLLDGVPTSTNVAYYAEIVREKALLRQLIGLGTKLAESAYANDAESKAIVTQTDAALTGLVSDAQMAVGAKSLAQTMPEVMAECERRAGHRGQLLGVSSGLPELDLLTHGWQKRKMVVVAGQTSFGKSILALNFARAAAAAGQRVVYYSFEMERQELTDRLLSTICDVPLTRLLWWNIAGEAEYARISEAMNVMHGLPLEINDSASRSIADIRAECRQIKADRGLGMVIIDHFQLMEGVGDNRYEQLADISTRIKRLSGELDVPIFVLSQLTLSDKDANREPHLDDLRQCKSLGHDADMVLMLHPYKPSEARNETPLVPFKLICRKNRGGRLGRVPLHLERDYVRFVPGEEPAPTPKAAKEPKAAKQPLNWADV